jgi:uncharacterized protein YdiU (UPF0061 family)
MLISGSSALHHPFGQFTNAHMNDQSQAAVYRGTQTFTALQDLLGDPVAPADFPRLTLRLRNDHAAAQIGLSALSDDDWLKHFGRFEALPNSLVTPLALRYHGHQFRVYNPEIGDGRGFLFAQMLDQNDRLMDLGTKGSGTTPWSRTADGRLTLKGAVREYLASEMLEALGVNTSRTFSIIETHEELWRGDEPSPTRSAVMVRLSHGHIRFGTFQRLAYLQDEAGMARLVRYCLKQYYPQIADNIDNESDGDCAAMLFDAAASRMADLVASYMVAGFVHGVLNTDNMNISGESFDYGPWRFAQHWQPGFTAAYFDHQGLYCFARQPEAFHWNLGQLGSALRMICPAEPLIATLDDFGLRYQKALTQQFCWRLGIVQQGQDKDTQLVQSAEQFLLSEVLTIDEFFFFARAHIHGRQTIALPPLKADEQKKLDDFLLILKDYQPTGEDKHPYWQQDKPQSMAIEEVESLWSAIAERDDWSPLCDKIAALRDMAKAHRHLQNNNPRYL